MKKVFAWLSGKKASAAPVHEPSPLRTMAAIDRLFTEREFEPAQALSAAASCHASMWWWTAKRTKR